MTEEKSCGTRRIPLRIYLGLMMILPNEEDFARGCEAIEWDLLGELFREEVSANVNISSDLLSRIVNDPLNTRDFFRTFDMRAAHVQGRIAGAIVNFVLSASSHRDTRYLASVTSAARFLHNLDRRNRGMSIENIQQNVWSKFRPVANLWAALQVFGSANGDLRKVEDADIPMLLSDAIQILALGEKCKLYRSRSYLLDRHTNMFGKWRPLTCNLKYASLGEEEIRLAISV